MEGGEANEGTVNNTLNYRLKQLIECDAGVFGRHGGGDNEWVVRDSVKGQRVIKSLNPSLG